MVNLEETADITQYPKKRRYKGRLWDLLGMMRDQIKGRVGGYPSRERLFVGSMHWLIPGLYGRMVSDFFHPVVGGVEGHIYSLGTELMLRGHHVCSRCALQYRHI